MEVNCLQRMITGDVVVLAIKLESWFGFTTLLGSARTSGMKGAARRWIGRTGHLTGKYNSTNSSLGVGDRRCRYQGTGIGMKWFVKYFLRFSHLNDFAKIHHGDMVAHALGN